MAPRRLIDDFELEVRARGLPSLGKVEASGLFADLLWLPAGDADYLRQRPALDPAFTITARTRWIALASILDEIRFYAAPIPEGAPSWWSSGEDPERVAAVRSEPDEWELGSFASVADAVSFAHSYLTGAALDEIPVAHHRRCLVSDVTRPSRA